MRPAAPQSGFTLVEISLALFAGALLLSAVYVSMISGQKSSAAMERKIAAQQDARAALELMGEEIAMASYNPNHTPDIWVDPNNCAGPPINGAYKGIQIATPDKMVVEMDIVENSLIVGPLPGGDENEVINYSYMADEQRITRSTNCANNQPFLGGDPNSGRPRTVRVINGDLGIPIFRYYDAQNPAGELNVAGNPRLIRDIRRIDITLAVETDQISPDTGQPKRMIYTSTVMPRNHAVSP